MSFLKFAPCVCVIGDEYEITVVAKQNGIIGVSVDGNVYYEENSGVLCTEKNYAKIRVNQKALNECKKYSIIFRKTIDRKAYFSEMGDVEDKEFIFKPLNKKSGINIYHVADVHHNFEIAAKTAAFFGENVDLFIFNGDLGETESVENYMLTLEFLGSLTGGKIPAVFARGNHDARGKLAERFTDFFPSDGKKTYYKFCVGNIEGLVLDCGEDKPDDYLFEDRPQPYVYNGVNVFSSYRRAQIEWLKKVELSPDKIKIVISHVCPIMASENKGDCFDIEREVYSTWNKELERLSVDFMLCAHYHHAFILTADDKRSIIPHKYPVIIGSELEGTKIINEKAYPEFFRGAAVTLSDCYATVSFTDQNGRIKERHVINFKSN